MKKILLFVVTFLVCSLIVTYQLFSQNILTIDNKGNVVRSEKENTNKRSSIDSVEITELYAMGVIPFPYGCPDTLGIRLKKNVAGVFDINVKITVQNIDTPFAVTDTASIIVSNFGTFDTLLTYQIPCQGVLTFLTYNRYRLIV